MGEPEGLDTEEPLPRRLERHAFNRLIMLSDGVFAIAITLAALETRTEGTWRSLPELWTALRTAVDTYAVSFGVVSAYWMAHRDIFARLSRVDGVLTWLALLLLGFVALLPVVTRMIYAQGPQTAPAMQLYFLMLAAVSGVQMLMWIYIAARPRLLMPGVSRRYRFGRIALSTMIGVLFVWLALSGQGAATGRGYLLLLGVLAIAALGRRVISVLIRERR